MSWSTWKIIEVIGLILAIAGGFVVASYSIFWLLDRGPFPRTGSGKITKKFLSQYRYRGPLSVGYGAIPAGSMKTSTTYKLSVHMSVGDSDIAVKKRFYDRVSVGELIHVKYSIGRFSRRIYLRKVWT